MAGAAPSRLPSVRDYDDLRAYLRDWLAARRRTNPRLSFRAFALRAGLPSPNHLKVVLDYGRPLTRRFLGHYAKALRLSPEDAEELGLLADVANARGPGARKAAREELAAWRASRRFAPLDPAFRFRAWWKPFLLQSLTCLRGFRADPRWISRRLRGRITPREARTALRRFVRQGSLRIRGGRAIVSRKEERILDLRDPEREREVRSGFLREAMDLRGGRNGYGDSCLSVMALTREEAARLQRDLERCILGHMPDPNRRVKGEVCLVLGEVLPLSGSAAPKKRYARK